MDPLKPSAALLCKLGSLIVHLEEGNSPNGHDFDLMAAAKLQNDPDVIAWMKGMNDMALIPRKRKPARPE